MGIRVICPYMGITHGHMPIYGYNTWSYAHTWVYYMGITPGRGGVEEGTARSLVALRCSMLPMQGIATYASYACPLPCHMDRHVCYPCKESRHMPVMYAPSHALWAVMYVTHIRNCDHCGKYISCSHMCSRAIRGIWVICPYMGIPHGHMR